MKNFKRYFLRTLTLVIGLGFLTTLFAGTCPETVSQDSQGYWVSNDSPGWKSPSPSKTGLTLNANNFGGVVYSPAKKRIACVYKDSAGNWVALLSDMYHPFNEDDLKNDVWEYSQQHKDYICGQPKNTRTECAFDIK